MLPVLRTLKKIIIQLTDNMENTENNFKGKGGGIGTIVLFTAIVIALLVTIKLFIN